MFNIFWIFLSRITDKIQGKGVCPCQCDTGNPSARGISRKCRPHSEGGTVHCILCRADLGRKNITDFQVNIGYKFSRCHQFLKQYIFILYTAKVLKAIQEVGTTIQTWAQSLHFDCFSPDPTQLFPLDLLQYLGKVALTLTLQDVNACLKVFVLDQEDDSSTDNFAFILFHELYMSFVLFSSVQMLSCLDAPFCRFICFPPWLE